MGVEPCGVGRWFSDGLFHVPAIIDNDKEQICALLKLYQKYYRIIGLVIAVVGGILTPFIPYLVKSDMPEGVSIYVVYLLNLFCTCMSYWLLAYKNSLLTAHQRNDVASKVMLVTNTFQYSGTVSCRYDNR